jgi:hypothetical protein
LAQLQPHLLLSTYWPAGIPRPRWDVYLIGPTGVVRRERAQLDTGADHNLFSATTALALGLTLPCARAVHSSGVAGAQAATFTAPPDGTVSLFVTDFQDYCYLPSPLIAFHPPGPSQLAQRSVLGVTGFLQHFHFLLDYGPSPPTFELHPLSTFPGSAGPLPRDRALIDFIRSLRAAA